MYTAREHVVLSPFLVAVLWIRNANICVTDLHPVEKRRPTAARGAVGVRNAWTTTHVLTT